MDTGIRRVLHLATNSEPSESTSARVFSFSGWAPYIVALGCIFDVLSTFFPWTVSYGKHLFLPFSIPLPFGWDAQFLEDTSFALAINVAIRLAAIVGLGGLVLHVFRRGILPMLPLFVSIGLSFASIAIFLQLDWSFYLGVHMVLAGGALKIAGLILENFELQVASKGSD